MNESIELARELVRADMAWRWRQGQGLPLENYLARFSDLAAHPSVVTELAFEEYLQRWMSGDPVPADEYRNRFGVDTAGWGILASGAEATAMRPCPGEEALNAPTRIVGNISIARGPNHPSAPDALDKQQELPRVGERFLGFELIKELGQGAFGRVFLARQESLAGRAVALKVSGDLFEESRNLAQLQHTHIVPIYSHHREGRLQAVCMPYLGCTTLADLCRGLKHDERLPTSGRYVISTVRQRLSTLQSLTGTAEPTGARDMRPHAEEPAELSPLGRMAYVNAVLWIGARLAEGLAHAHERGILHLDLKPANVLMTDDGRPMLLDFNLAEDTKRRGAARAHIGGTLPYMSPEQMQAFTGTQTLLDGRCDVYALGLILYRLLTGRPAFRKQPGSLREALPPMLADRLGATPRLRQFNPGVTPAAEAIIRHCLEPDRERRYPSAQALAEDLDRQCADLPLKHIPEPSLSERMGKWARRHPRVASPVAMGALLVGFALSVAGLAAYSSFRAAERDAERLRAAAEARQDRFEEQAREANRLLIDDDPARVAEGARAGLDALGVYGVLDDPNWDAGHAVRLLPPHRREALRREVGEVAFLLSRAALFHPRKKLTLPVEKLQALAAAQLGEHGQAALAALREDLAGRDGAAAARGQPGLPSLLACQHVAAGRFGDALPLLAEEVRARPDWFGGWYLKGRCHQMLGQDSEAVASYSTCIVLRPESTQAYLARATVSHALQRNLPQAKADLDEALRLRPGHLDARLERGLVSFGMGRLAEARKDLDLVLESPSCPSRAWFVRATVRDRTGDKAGADRDRAEGMKLQPTDATSWVARGVARLRAGNNEGALDDFRRAEEENPRSLEAMNNQAYVLGELQKKPKEALAALDRLLRVYPQYVNGLGGRAVLLARLGQHDEAIAEARRCLDLSSEPENHYRVACIFALAAKGAPDRLAEARRLLASALLRGWGHEHLAGDTDLAALRGQAEFRRLVEAVSFLQAWNGTQP